MNLVRHSAHLLGPSEALHRVFVPSSTFVSPFCPHQCRHSPNSLLPQVRHYQSHRGTAGLRHTRSRRHDEAINDPLVHVVSSDSNALLPAESPRAILARINRKTHSLVEVSPATETRAAICRIFSKQKLSKDEKPKTKEKPEKQLELSWTIDPNDLRHKLNRLKGFLEGGRRVELIIAQRKRRGAKAREVTKEDRNKFLATIRAFVQALDGVREWKAMAEVGGNEKPAENGGDVEMVQRKRQPVTVMLYFESTKNVDTGDV